MQHIYINTRRLSTASFILLVLCDGIATRLTTDADDPLRATLLQIFNITMKHSIVYVYVPTYLYRIARIAPSTKTINFGENPIPILHRNLTTVDCLLYAHVRYVSNVMLFVSFTLGFWRICRICVSCHVSFLVIFVVVITKYSSFIPLFTLNFIQILLIRS